MRRFVLALILPIILLGSFGWLIVFSAPYVEMVAAYKAKILCSAKFVSGRDVKKGRIEDVAAGDLEPLKFLPVKIDDQNRSVTVTVWPQKPVTAIYREGIGATLALDASVEELRQQKPILPPDFVANPDQLWPGGERVDLSAEVEGVDLDSLKQQVATAFALPDNPPRTRAVVVVYDGRIVAEQYADGFTAQTRLPGWSMAKGVTNAMVGLLVKQGKLALDDDALLEQWSGADDPRRAIKLDDLMRMSSGLNFREDYSIDPEGDISMMLFRGGDAAGFAIAKTLNRTPGSFFQYSSGTTNIISRIIQKRIGDDARYSTFPYRELFHPIGAGSAIFERDASGTFVGSSFLYATPRDWARFGLLYAQDGVWDGKRILPEGWVDYSRSLAPADKAGEHTAHFWAKIQGKKNRPTLPQGIFHMAGHEGQFVSIMPEQKMVVVRMGLTLDREMWHQEQFIGKILECFK